MSAKNATITRDIIREHAKVFVQKMNITDFKYSIGWLNIFKKRQGFSQYIQIGGTVDVDEDVTLNDRKKYIKLRMFRIWPFLLFAAR